MGGEAGRAGARMGLRARLRWLLLPPRLFRGRTVWGSAWHASRIAGVVTVSRIPRGEGGEGWNPASERAAEVGIEGWPVRCGGGSLGVRLVGCQATRPSRSVSCPQS